PGRISYRAWRRRRRRAERSMPGQRRQKTVNVATYEHLKSLGDEQEQRTRKFYSHYTDAVHLVFRRARTRISFQIGRAASLTALDCRTCFQVGTWVARKFDSRAVT